MSVNLNPKTVPFSLTIYTSRDRQKRALELRAQGASYGVIALELGVSRGTAVNYIKGYPYRCRRAKSDNGDD